MQIETQNQLWYGVHYEHSVTAVPGIASPDPDTTAARLQVGLSADATAADLSGSESQASTVLLPPHSMADSTGSLETQLQLLEVAELDTVGNTHMPGSNSMEDIRSNPGILNSMSFSSMTRTLHLPVRTQDDISSRAIRPVPDLTASDGGLPGTDIINVGYPWLRCMKLCMLIARIEQPTPVATASIQCSRQAVTHQVRQQVLHDIKHVLPTLHGLASTLRSEGAVIEASSKLDEFQGVISNIQDSLKDRIRVNPDECTPPSQQTHRHTGSVMSTGESNMSPYLKQCDVDATFLTSSARSFYETSSRTIAGEVSKAAPVI